NPAGDNPVLNGANIKKTKSKCVWSREGNITTYEWAVQVYDHFPTQTQIEPGKRIGFDVIVANLDRPDGKTNYHAAWLPFGAPAPWKMFDASSLADLVFLAKDVPLVPVQGSVTDPTGEGLNANLRVSIFQIFAPVGGGYIRKVPMGEEQTNAAGQFTISLPPGKYVAEPAKNEILRHAKTEFTVEQDKQCHVYLAVAPLNSVSVLGKDVMPLVVPFIEAIKNNKTKDALEILHMHHPIAKARDYHNGASALSIAAEKENLQLMEALIKAGADVNAADEQNTTALHEAAENGNGVIVQVLLKNGANPEIVETDYGCTPLLWAVYGYEHNQPVQDQLEIVKALVHAGANPNAKNNEGKNALNMASKDDPMRKLLIDLGVKD
ncbi:MAG: ankyrin repeat domain-containing protein, partial [Chthoniobacterales bacterium]